MSERQISFAQALREGLREEMRRDPSVVIIGEDVRVSSFGVTESLWQEFGDARVRDTPISEAGFIGMCLGAAMTGLRPVAELMLGDFVTVCMDQLANQAAKIRYMSGGHAEPHMVVRVGVSGPGVRVGAQHSQSLEGWFLHVPGLRVVYPATPYDAKGLLKAAIRGPDPVMFFEHKLVYGVKGPVPESDYTVPIGKAEIKKEGKDVTIACYGYMLHKSLAAARRLAREGIEAEVVDLRTLSPMDKETLLGSVKRTGRMVTVEDGCKTGGVGAEISAIVCEEAYDDLEAPIRRVAALDLPLPANGVLEDAALPNERKIIDAVKSTLKTSASA